MIEELPRDLRFKFFVTQIQNASKGHLINSFENLEKKSAFDTLRTDKLKKIAALLGETETTSFDFLASKYEKEEINPLKIELRQIVMDLEPKMQERITVNY
jgi:hypothetical protein